MSDAGDSQHKRSKSAALSILRRKDRSSGNVSGNGGNNGNNGAIDDDIASEDGSLHNLTPSPSATSQNVPSPAVRGHVSRMSSVGGSITGRTPPSSSALYGASPGKPTTMLNMGAAAAATAGTPGSSSSSSAPPAPTPPPPPQPAAGHNLLEQSVRKFRIVEALRSGDTVNITKAIRETADGNPRQSLSSQAAGSGGGGCSLDDTTVLHLAIQCAEFPVVEYVLAGGGGLLDVNARDKDGNTPLHLAAAQGRTQVVRLLLEQKEINDAIANAQGRLPLDLARNPEIFQLLQLSRSLFAESKVREVQDLIARGEYKTLAQVLEEPRLKTVLDINSSEFASDPITAQAGGTLLHEAARRKNSQLIQVLLLHGADPFRRDRKGKLPQDVTKDDVTRAMLKRSPAAVAAQRGIQEKAVLGAAAQGSGMGYSESAASGAAAAAAAAAAAGGGAGGAGGGVGGGGIGGLGNGVGIGGAASGTTAVAGGFGHDPLAGREAREMKGYLKKWTNYRKGYQLRWFVLEDGVLSYYKHQDDAGSACRGAINMRIARLHMSADEKTKFEIIGKSSVKYTLKANHEVEAKRWFWALNNSIQWTKDQAKEEVRQRAREAELLRQAKAEHSHSLQPQLSYQSGGGASGMHSQTPSVAEPSENASVADNSVARRGSTQLPRVQSSRGAMSRSGGGSGLPATAGGVGASMAGSVEDDTTTGFGGADGRVPEAIGEEGGGLGDEDEYDDGSSGRGGGGEHGVPTATRDAFNITAQSAKLQLETMAQVNQALVAESSRSPPLTLTDPKMVGALATYDAAIRSLAGLVGDLMRISRDRDASWQYRLDREVDMRRMWEESMAQVAREQEALEARVGEAEEKKKAARRILKEVIGRGGLEKAQAQPRQLEEEPVSVEEEAAVAPPDLAAAAGAVATTTTATTDEARPVSRRKSIEDVAAELSDSESEDEEFFDAVDAGEVEVEPALPSEASKGADIVVTGGIDISSSFAGYENGIRDRLKIDADNRPKLSLWSILKSMVGKDMTKMTLPVTFNEPTSLLYRCGEDMEYADLLDRAADLSDSIDRLIYVAAFAASEYASTIGRVAKPFNPLLGETFEYVRPDKNYRFFIEQVSHHPPVGAAWAESPRWTYYGESAVKSKFYGRSFDINPLGTWFLKLRPAGGGREDFYTWKKVTSSVIGIITGNPTVDNYGPMEIKNWTTGEVAYVDFKPRGWTAASAYLISGKVVDASGRVRVSLGGRWNSKLYARLTPGYQMSVTADGEDGSSSSSSGNGSGSASASGSKVHVGSLSDQNKVFLIWKANERPKGIPFNLTPFVLTFNHIDEQLRPWLAPTDSRLRPDQRAMEEGQYDLAATEKNRLETEQRDRRREREARGEEFVPAYFARATCPVTGETYWHFNGRYWDDRERAGRGDTSVWDRLEPIFLGAPSSSGGGGVKAGAKSSF